MLQIGQARHGLIGQTLLLLLDQSFCCHESEWWIVLNCCHVAGCWMDTLVSPTSSHQALAGPNQVMPSSGGSADEQGWVVSGQQ